MSVQTTRRTGPALSRLAGLALTAFLALAVTTPALAQTSQPPPAGAPSSRADQTPPGSSASPTQEASQAAGAAAAPTPQAVFDRRAGTQDLSPLTNNDLGVRPPPFGADLFYNGAQAPVGGDVLDPNYVMKPGDKVQVTFFGLINQSAETTIDSKGNIVLPNVGPVRLGGVPAGQVNTVVSAVTRAVFKSGVQVYAAAENTAPIQVLVTGGVHNPGPYPGSSTDSLVAYLQRAGGVDENRGSYRRITVERGGAPIAQADLYDFLANGRLPKVAFRNGDVILVGEQGSVVSVSGAARAPFTFELAERIGQGAEILAIAKPRPEATHAGVAGIRGGAPYNVYLPLEAFARLALADGDRVSFQADAPAQTLVIRVAGAKLGPSFYTVDRDTSLAQLLARIPLDAQADSRSIFLRRLSVARAQKQALDENLGRLQRALFVASTVPSTNSSSLSTEAAATQQYVQDARNFQPLGDVALPAGADLTRVRLEQDDTIVIPFKSDVVTVGGEVVAPQSALYRPGATAIYYIRLAGGFSDVADRGKVLVVHPDGTFVNGGRVDPGDRIQVLPKVFNKSLAIAQVLTQILYQIGISVVAFKGL